MLSVEYVASPWHSPWPVNEWEKGMIVFEMCYTCFTHVNNCEIERFNVCNEPKWKNIERGKKITTAATAEYRMKGHDGSGGGGSNAEQTTMLWRALGKCGRAVGTKRHNAHANDWIGCWHMSACQFSCSIFSSFSSCYNGVRWLPMLVSSFLPPFNRFSNSIFLHPHHASQTYEVLHAVWLTEWLRTTAKKHNALEINAVVLISMCNANKMKRVNSSTIRKYLSLEREKKNRYIHEFYRRNRNGEYVCAHNLTAAHHQLDGIEHFHIRTYFDSALHLHFNVPLSSVQFVAGTLVWKCVGSLVLLLVLILLLQRASSLRSHVSYQNIKFQFPLCCIRCSCS